MATSSITETLRVNNPKLLEAYAEALEKSESEPVIFASSPIHKEDSDPDAIRDILLRNIENWGKINK
ncbi:hypothetical protein [Ruminococcus sp. HUN007]|uniref:hypothetical protein n=1 Tax=Ruminococcus sp. HUN007 TaxID=1514668 RepID=UPI0005D25E26|nr:hypothetical protein [Ruminococcus sp. HUN007]